MKKESNKEFLNKFISYLFRKHYELGSIDKETMEEGIEYFSSNNLNEILFRYLFTDNYLLPMDYLFPLN